MEKITPEVARLEVEKWLDYKKVKSSKRENLSDQIDILVDNVVDGTLVLEEGCKFTHELSFPLKNEEGKDKLKTLIYKPRVNVQQINTKMTGLKPTDADGRILGYIAALTDQPLALIAKMDTEDVSIGKAFAMFFL